MISLFKKKEAPVYPADTATSRDGRPIVFTFFKHASLAVDFDGRRIYVDPVGEYADYAHLPKADAVLVTHSHYHHLDRAAVELLMTPATAVVCDKTSAEAFDFDCYTMVPGAMAEPLDGIRVEAVAAYNTTEGHLQFHPREREDCGYVLTLGGTRVYTAAHQEHRRRQRADARNAFARRDRHRVPARQPALYDDRRSGGRGGAGATSRDLLSLSLRGGRADHRSRPAGARGGGADRDAGSPDGVMRLRSERRGGSATLPLFSLLSAMRAGGVGRERVDALVRKGGVVDNFS